ncbi:MAG TPA: hypothetical protein VJ914_03215 [Pseudonocardiaceae bacterium]|nr:hypothetical protein [Pseudonocardiaceae bacterium]
MDDGGYRLAESVVAIIGIREGLVTIILKLIGHDNPGWMSLPLYLPDAWCYVVASAIVVVAFAALVVLDKARLALRTGTRNET